MNKQARLIVAGPLVFLLIGATEVRQRRYRDQGNGTVEDAQSGLVWLAHANCLGSMSWEGAMAEVAELREGMCGLTDGSEPGDWRLPTKAEWQAMVECSCGEIALADDRGTDCYSSSISTFHNVQASDYWSSTESIRGGTVRVMSLTQGMDSGVSATTSLPVWPVRRASESERLRDGR